MCSGTPCAGFAVKSCCCCVCSSVAGCIAPPLWSWYGKPSAGFLLFCTTAAGPIVAVATVCGVEMLLLMFAGLTCCYSCCFCYLKLLVEFTREGVGRVGLLSLRCGWYLANNNLSGNLHKLFDRLKDVRYCDIRGNNFNGLIPAFLAQWKDMRNCTSWGTILNGLNYDLLLQHRLHIAGEVKLAIRHCLLANHGIEVQDLKMVLSHPQALAQCENTLTRLGMVREAVDDTAGAAKDDSDNVTRYLVLSREPTIPGTDRLFKVSFSLYESLVIVQDNLP
ncbi:hypothetical protein LOK49_LG15G01546 [Camellia lanceoleosa]|uniref:Uncharacterized protein n=1 Tax=Camellia lanceoleosa TaxID=1840588 RepID=A0ACC0F1H5_9ERIC|nr:hypothetical protein LOK49_LG15G01546 [Camellia lanceoleosa]